MSSKPTDKVTVREAIEETRVFLNILAGPGELLQKKDFFTAARGRAVPALRCLLEAVEESSNQDWQTEEGEWGWPQEKNRQQVKENKTQAETIVNLMSECGKLGLQLDRASRRDAELLKRLTRKGQEVRMWKDHAWKLDNSIIKLVKTFGDVPPPETLSRDRRNEARKDVGYAQ